MRDSLLLGFVSDPSAENSVRRSPLRFLSFSLLISVFILSVSDFTWAQNPDGSDGVPPVSDLGSGGESDLGSEAVAAQDPAPVEERPADPDEQLHQEILGYFQSEQSADWVRALTLLGTRIETAETPQWLGSLLLDLLIDKSEESPERTRTILGDRILSDSINGIPIFLVLLRQDASWPFLAEVENNFRLWCADSEIRERLLTELSVGKDALLITRLLPILAARDPRRTVEVAIGRLTAEPEGSFVALEQALSSFLKLDLERSEWAEWWQENRDQPIVSGILERQRSAALTRELKTWERANRLLREVSPQRFRSWLLDSLRDTEPGAVRSVAIVECGRFSRELQKEGSGIEPELLQELLIPVRDRLLEIISQLENPKAENSLAERQDLAVGCFAALSQLTSFREDPVLVDLLKQWIRTLTPESTNGKRRIAREALKMAATLRAPVARAVDDALERFRPARGKTTDTAELRRLIAASRAIGCTSHTVDLFDAIGRNVPELQEAVLEALVFGEIPDDAIEQVLTYYGNLLENSASENNRALAINGIGRLGVEDAIPMLTRLVLGESGNSELERKAALTMVRSIGGPRSLEGIIEILLLLPDSDSLYPAALADAIGMIPTDPSLGLVRRLLLAESGQRHPWYQDVMGSDGVVEALQAKGQPTDLRTRSPGRFEQWILLQSLRLEGLVIDLVAQEGTTTEDWQAVLGELTATIELFGTPVLAPDLEVYGKKIRSLAIEIAGRLSVEEALAAGESERVTEAFRDYLANIVPEGPNSTVPSLFPQDPWDWLLNRIEQRPPLEGDPALVRSLRTLAEGLSARDDVRERLDLLEARADSGGKERSPSPPLPVPDEEAEGRE
ncbi:MAG: HEAT repeat domain-containing protein [Planctomycetota bacterium]